MFYFLAFLLVFTQIFDRWEIYHLKIYQWVVVLWLIYGFAVCIKMIQMKKWRFFWQEVLVKIKNNKGVLGAMGGLLLFSLLGLIRAEDRFYALYQTGILLSFIIIFLLIVNFINQEEKKLVFLMKVFIASSLPVTLFALYQNIALEKGWKHFQVMLARPNAFFYEPDWLGMYLIFVLSLLFPYFFWGREKESLLNKRKIKLFLIVVLNFLVLVLSVARASWVAIFLSSLLLLGFILGEFLKGIFAKREMRFFLKDLVILFFAFSLSLALIKVFHLTRFNLLDRVKSIVKKEHIITVAEKEGEKKKIDLEEIEEYRLKGYNILEEKIPDENVFSRIDAYSSNWEMVKQYIILGQGQGSVLRKREFVHNAGNLFFEWWISAGILGLGSFLFLLGLILKPFYWAVFSKKIIAKENKNRRLLVFGSIILGVFSLILVNLFNSGIFFPSLWIMIAILYGAGRIEDGYFRLIK